VDLDRPAPLPGRVAAVDWGRRRIGLAISDALGLTVRGLATVTRPRAPAQAQAEAEAEAETVAEVARRLVAEQAVRIVVGLPLHASGEESDSSRAARRFGEALGRACGLPVEFLDEGLTSWEAEEEVRARGGRLLDAQRRGEIDQRAAMALLRSWLQER
jgi:putative Holliday junction resolvase